MRIKSFFAASVEAALDDARRELGPEAMLIQSRPAPADARALGDYEVVCALLPADAAPQNDARLIEAPNAQTSEKVFPDPERLANELEALRNTVGQLHFHMMRKSGEAGESRHCAALEPLHAALLDADVEPNLVEAWVEEASGDESMSAQAARTRLRERIAAAIPVRPFPDPETDGPAIAALVGPPGAGKTSCLVKIAARCGTARRRSTQIILLDEHRIASSVQLRTYAAILGARFHFLSHVDELGPVLDKADRGDLVLIDTPGFSFGEEAACHNLARALGERTSLQAHLVLPASSRCGDLRRISDFYEPFHAQGLIFTRLDETGVRGAIANEAVRTQRPVLFLSAGPRIPEDLEAATGERIAELLLSSHPSPRRAVAAGT